MKRPSQNTSKSFEQWFRAQYGKRPSKLTRAELLKLFEPHFIAEAMYEQLLRDCQFYDEMKTAAYRAWLTSPLGYKSKSRPKRGAKLSGRYPAM